MGDTDTVSKLLEGGVADPTYGNSWSIRAAVDFNDIAVVKLLLDDDRVDHTSCDNHCTYMAKQMGFREILELIWSKNYNELKKLKQ